MRRGPILKKEKNDVNEIGNTTVIQSSQTRVAPSLGEILRQPRDLDRLDRELPQTSKVKQDNSRSRLTYFAAVSESLPDLAPSPGAWQQSKFLSSSALLANELHVLDDSTRRKKKGPAKVNQNNHGNLHECRILFKKEIKEDT